MASKALVAASTKPLILSILWHEENYGYQIIKEVEKLSGGRMAWTEAMLYPVLHRMDREGLISSRWELSPEERRRKYYAITVKGRAALEAERREWLEVHHVFQKLWTSMPGLSPA